MRRRNEKQRSVQDSIPLLDMRAWLARMVDGSLRSFLRIPGRNESLVTEAQSERDARKLADVLSSIKVPFAILKYPMPTSSSAYLVQIDRAISRERAKLNAARTDDEARACQLKLAILEGSMRPEAKQESTSDDRLQWPTYLVLKFDRGETEAEAMQETENLVRVTTERLGKPPARVDAAELVRLCGMYFAPQSMGAETCTFGGGVVLPMRSWGAGGDERGA